MSVILQITSADRETGLSCWRGERASAVAGFEVAADGGLPGWFSRVAAERADAVAVADGLETLSYRELEVRSTAIAVRLVLDFGVGRGELVGVVMERGVGAVVVILGVLKAGAAYAPMEATSPVERTRGILEEAGVKVVVADSPVKDALSGSGWAVMTPEVAGDAVAGAMLPLVGAEDLAYVIYTSGSTGKPKGVPVRHGQVARVIEEGRSIYGLSAADVWTLFHSFAFDFSVWEMWGALLTGGRLVVVPWLVAREPLEFHRLLAREQVTVLNQTPSAFRMLMEVENEAGLAGPALRLVILAGETLDFGCLRPWLARHGD